MGNAFDISSLEWEPVRPNITLEVFGKTLVDDKIKVVLTRVAPGGIFKTHRDHYGHLFYFLSGSGIVKIADKQYDAHPGVTIQIQAGEIHSYENTGTEDLTLISMNLPAES